MLRFVFEEGVSMESGGREAKACLGQGKMEPKERYGRGCVCGGDTSRMTQPAQNQVPHPPPELLPHLFY